MNLLLKDLTWLEDDRSLEGDIRIRNGVISEIGSSLVAEKKEKTISLKTHYAYPGLINAHDHLEMNLYPRMGNPPYANYTQWAKDIYFPDQSPVKEIESIPRKYRLLWGGLKNLISGVTTVAHHNPWHRILGAERFPIKVLKKYGWAHSLAFEKNVVRKFPSKTTTPFIIHAAEGVDETARGEVQKLHELKLLKDNSVIVHGVGVDSHCAGLLAEANSSLVWCPASNLFMFGKTANIPFLKDRIRICLGSDSLMTGSVSLSEEMRVAAKTGMASAREILQMVTRAPAAILRLPEPAIRKGQRADLLILPMALKDYHENVLAHRPENVTAVIVEGRIAFTDEAISRDLDLALHSIKINNAVKKITLDVGMLKGKISKKVSERVLQGNELWRMLEGS